MKCPTCGHEENRVLSTQGATERVTRLRQCCQCGKRWKTVEAPIELINTAERLILAARQFEELASDLERALEILKRDGK